MYSLRDVETFFATLNRLCTISIISISFVPYYDNPKFLIYNQFLISLSVKIPFFMNCCSFDHFFILYKFQVESIHRSHLLELMLTRGPKKVQSKYPGNKYLSTTNAETDS